MPGISVSATALPIWPVAVSRSKTTTRPSAWRPTATRVPSLLNEKWRGLTPPAGAVWTCVRAPVSGSTEKVMSGSEGTVVPLASVNSRLLSRREERVMNLLSGCVV